MTEVFFYTSTIERKSIVLQQEKLGKTLIADDFIDSAGAATNGQSGRLTFDIRSNTETAKQTQYKAILEKLRLDTANAADMRYLLRIIFGV